MNIIELARLCDLGRVCGPLDTLFDDEWDMLHRFANAVIKAHTEELIAGAGEPWHREYDEVDKEMVDCYTASQVAAAVAKAKNNYLNGYCEGRKEMLERIATLESTLKVALEVLTINQYAVADQAPHKDVMNYNAAIEKIEEVLHAE